MMTELGNSSRYALAEALKADSSVLRFVLDQNDDCIKILSADGQIDYVNVEGTCRLKIGNIAEIIGKRWPELWPEESRATIVEALNVARTGKSSKIEAWRPDRTGQKRWWQISVSPLVENDDSLAAIMTVSRDVTDHVVLRESERTLSLEMRHRLRNSYTVASAIVMQSAKDNSEVQEFAETVTARLADVAISQTRLLEAGEKTWPLEELISTLVSAHGEGASGITHSGSDGLVVDGHSAMLIALVVGELTNNSLKYGALRRSKGVALTWAEADGQLTLTWRERLPPEHSGKLKARNAGSGYAMMARMARAQRARFEHEVDNDELVVRVNLPPAR